MGIVVTVWGGGGQVVLGQKSRMNGLTDQDTGYIEVGISDGELLMLTWLIFSIISVKPAGWQQRTQKH